MLNQDACIYKVVIEAIKGITEFNAAHHLDANHVTRFDEASRQELDTALSSFSPCRQLAINHEELKGKHLNGKLYSQSRAVTLI